MMKQMKLLNPARALFRSLIVYSIFFTLHCFGDAPVQYNMEKISLEKAKTVLETGAPAKLYPNAIAAVLASDMKEEYKARLQKPKEDVRN